MPQTHKVLGQVSPSAATLTSLYACPSGTQAVCSTLTICNTTATAMTYRVAVRPAGAAISTQHYITQGAWAGVAIRRHAHFAVRLPVWHAGGLQHIDDLQYDCHRNDLQSGRSARRCGDFDTALHRLGLVCGGV